MGVPTAWVIPSTETTPIWKLMGSWYSTQSWLAEASYCMLTAAPGRSGLASSITVEPPPPVPEDVLELVVVEEPPDGPVEVDVEVAPVPDPPLPFAPLEPPHAARKTAVMNGIV